MFRPSVVGEKVRKRGPDRPPGLMDFREHGHCFARALGWGERMSSWKSFNEGIEFRLAKPGENFHRLVCCSVHGCKFGEPDCPVENQQTEQAGDCEYCN